MDALLNEHKKIIELLLKHKVDFIIVGGYAVIFHGFARTTLDIDMWLKQDDSNKKKLIDALKEYGIIEEDLIELEKRDFKSTLVFHIGEEPYKVDFLTKISGVEYKEANIKKVFFNLENQQVPVLDLHQLILSKVSSSRPKDKIDIEELQRIAKYRKK